MDATVGVGPPTAPIRCTSPGPERLPPFSSLGEPLPFLLRWVSRPKFRGFSFFFSLSFERSPNPPTAVPSSTSCEAVDGLSLRSCLFSRSIGQKETRPLSESTRTRCLSTGSQPTSGRKRGSFGHSLLFNHQPKESGIDPLFTNILLPIHFLTKVLLLYRQSCSLPVLASRNPSHLTRIPGTINHLHTGSYVQTKTNPTTWGLLCTHTPPSPGRALATGTAARALAIRTTAWSSRAGPLLCTRASPSRSPRSSRPNLRRGRPRR